MIALASELSHFLAGMHHGGGGACREQENGHDIHGDIIGDVVNQRLRLPHRGEMAAGMYRAIRTHGLSFQRSEPAAT